MIYRGGQITVIDVLEGGACYEGVVAAVNDSGGRIAGDASDIVAAGGATYAALDGYGYGDGDGDGYGYGYGDGDGYGYGYGYGYGDGDGYGSGDGYGYGDGDGYGSGEQVT